jgi:hypothetical protein
MSQISGYNVPALEPTKDRDQFDYSDEEWNELRNQF